uniref:pyridoxamine 5'-phosphate oxidase family protein n=1 Tax=Mesorhizobium sp. 113-3-3 TaxID=2744516 RepID=UPI001FD10C89|nr:pyridoxamine 5'-phosphate oxidase family protein [Mesorhizobium sp. 113-3-3]
MTNPKGTLAWSDSRHCKYATISGSAAVTNDRKKIADLWEKTDALCGATPTIPRFDCLQSTPTKASVAQPRIGRCYGKK